ncbi:MAG TPA: ABC transporter permease [Geobacterales bacterium]|nr:ABC transporter permease [Geobacterales bacterium]
MLILVISFLLLSLNNATANLQDFAKNSWTNYVGDIRIAGNLTPSFLNALESAPYIQSATGLSLFYTNVESTNGNYSALIIYCSNPNGLMGYEISAGNKDGLLLVTSSNIKLSIGEEIAIKSMTSKINAKITGYASAFYNFGLVDIMLIANKSLMEGIGKSYFDYIFAKLNSDKDLESKLNNLALQSGSKISSIIALDPNAYPGKEDVDAASSVFNIFSMIILIVIFVALASYQFIYLEMNEKELYYLRAIGFSSKSLIATYTLPQIFVLLVALLLGSAVSLPFSKFLFDAALKSTPITFSDVLLNRFQFSLKSEPLILSNVTILATFFITLLPVIYYVVRKKSELYINKAQSFRRLGIRFKMIFYSSSKKVWRHALLVIIFALIISSTSSVSMLIKNWDSSVVEYNSFYDYFIYATGSGSIPYIYNASVLTATFHLAKVNDRSVVTASFVELGSVAPKLIEGRWPSNENEAVLSVTLSKNLGVGINDEVLLNTGFRNYTLRVVGIAFLPLFYLYTRETDAIVLSYELYSKIFTATEGYAIFLKGNLEQALEKLRNNGFTTYVRTEEDSINIALQGGRVAIVFLNFLSYTLVLSAVSLIAIFVISELYSRNREYAMLMLLGYRAREILAMLAISLMLISLISLPISYLISIYLLNVFQSEILSFTGYFEPSPNLIELFSNFLYIFIPIAVVLLFALRYLKRLKINETLLK